MMQSPANASANASAIEVDRLRSTGQPEPPAHSLEPAVLKPAVVELDRSHPHPANRAIVNRWPSAGTGPRARGTVSRHWHCAVVRGRSCAEHAAATPEQLPDADTTVREAGLGNNHGECMTTVDYNTARNARYASWRRPSQCPGGRRRERLRTGHGGIGVPAGDARLRAQERRDVLLPLAGVIWCCHALATFASTLLWNEMVGIAVAVAGGVAAVTLLLRVRARLFQVRSRTGLAP